MRMIPDLLQSLRQLLPPEVYVPLLVVLALVLLPAWLNWLRTKQLRGQLRRMIRARDEATRESHHNAAFALAANRPWRLVALADEALSLGQRPVFREALEALEATGKLPEEAARLRAKVEVEPKRGGHPLEEAVILERMWEQGLHDAARERLAEVRERFPHDPDLAALHARFHEEAAAGS